MNVFDTLMLPNGSTIKNRIAKAAMEENMADAEHAPSEQLMRLYQAWAEGGAGLLISGNVMVDSRAMTGPGGVVLDLFMGSGTTAVAGRAIAIVTRATMSPRAQPCGTAQPVKGVDLVVCGHTVVEEVCVLGNVLYIDTGACFGGPLTAVALAPNERPRFLRAA